MDRLSLLTRLLLWALTKRPEISNIYTKQDDEFPTEINYFPESEGGYPGAGSREDIEFKREWLQHCFDRTGPSRGSSTD